MEPAEERPPSPYPMILSLDSEIAAIPSSPVARRNTDIRIPEEYILPEEPVQRPEPETTSKEDSAASGSEKPVSTSEAVPQFSAPLISSLEKGMYYIQVRAYSRRELVQPELTRLGVEYPLAVQTGGSSEKPIYRILVGPVNLGESNALLQRFKGSGYNDAFVRRSE
jgi:cell division septation protein DedD